MRRPCVPARRGMASTSRVRLPSQRLANVVRLEPARCSGDGSRRDDAPEALRAGRGSGSAWSRPARSPRGLEGHGLGRLARTELESSPALAGVVLARCASSMPSAICANLARFWPRSEPHSGPAKVKLRSWARARLGVLRMWRWPHPRGSPRAGATRGPPSAALPPGRGGGGEREGGGGGGGGGRGGEGGRGGGGGGGGEISHVRLGGAGSTIAGGFSTSLGRRLNSRWLLGSAVRRRRARFSRHLARVPAPGFVASRDSSAGSGSRRR